MNVNAVISGCCRARSRSATGIEPWPTATKLTFPRSSAHRPRRRLPALKGCCWVLGHINAETAGCCCGSKRVPNSCGTRKRAICGRSFDRCPTTPTTAPAGGPPQRVNNSTISSSKYLSSPSTPFHPASRRMRSEPCCEAHTGQTHRQRRKSARRANPQTWGNQVTADSRFTWNSHLDAWSSRFAIGPGVQHIAC